MYRFLEREYDLTLEEQEAARFILDTCARFNMLTPSGTVLPPGSGERAALELFKADFYRVVMRRLSWGFWDSSSLSRRMPDTGGDALEIHGGVSYSAMSITDRLKLQVTVVEYARDET